MRTSVASLIHKTIALCAAFALACSMVPLAWADDGSAATAAGIAAGDAEAVEAALATEDAAAPDDAPEASAQSADAKAAGSSAGPGTTVSIQVYRSSYPLVWDLNDEGSADVTKAQWGNKPAAWPTEGSPGSPVGKCEGYVPWTDDANPGSEPSRLGFNFMGWSTEPDIAVEGTGKLDTLALSKDAPIVEGSDGVKRITLYALWAPVEYSVVFDLTKNPEDASAVPSFSWTTGKGTFSDLGGGRYRLSGVTLQDYDPATGLIEIATPARGSGGYRFLSWAEPESQQDPAVAVMKSGSAKWFVNPVALPHYDYEPVLTARWALSFDVDVPSQVTFDQYDSLEVEGNLTDTTDKDMVDEESADPHDAGKLAHFCSQSTASDYKIVALKSVKQPTAEKVLTTSDSSKASPEEVLGGTDEKGVEHEGEKLLSLFAQGATAEEQGVHFRLDDAIDMDDSSRYGSFVIPKQTKPYADSDYSRDDEERLCVSYRLNLDNKVDGASEPNHGLVVPENVQEGDRTPIAEVSYEFAVADAEVETTKGHPPTATGSTSDAFYIEHAGKVYGPADIKASADCIALHGTSSPCYELYHEFLTSGMDPADAADAHGYVRWGDGSTYNVRIIGINHDDVVDGTGALIGKAGLTFEFVNSLKKLYPFTSNNRNAEGWVGSALRSNMNSGAIWNQVPSQLEDQIVSVRKCSQGGGTSYTKSSTSNDKLFLIGYAEVMLSADPSWSKWWQGLVNERGSLDEPYQYYMQFGLSTNARMESVLIKSSDSWWYRTAYPGNSTSFALATPKYIAGYDTSGVGSGYSRAVAPCFCL